MQTQNTLSVLPVDDGTTINIYTAAPEGDGIFPGIILFQEAFGLTGHIRGIADQLAAAGYIVIAPELFHRTAEAGATFSYDDWGTITPHFQAITVPGLQADARAAYQWLLQQPNVLHDKIGSIGFCLGGRVSFIANCTLPLSAAVSFYGGGLHNFANMATEAHGPQLFFWGGSDKSITLEHIDTVTNAMKLHNKTYTSVVFSAAGHAFNNNERASYNADASTEAWALTMAFLKNKLQ